MSVCLGLYIHQQTRSKKVTDTLSKLNLTIPYDQILKIETVIADEILTNIDNNGIFVPPNKIYNTTLCNVDFSNDTPDGKTEFHEVG